MRLPCENFQKNIKKLKETVMNIIKKLPLMAFVLGLGFMITMCSFKSEVKKSTIYYYNYSSSSFASMQIPGNWGTAQDTDFTCAGIQTIPCAVIVPNGETIDDYLASFSNLPDLLLAADGRRKLK
jgi:hypothetical protein